MNPTRRHLPALAALTLLILAAGCSDRDPTELPVARANGDPVVFDDAYSPDVYFQAFFETNSQAVAMDSVYAYDGYAPDGSRSLKVTIAPAGSALGPYSGGVLTSSGMRDLTGYNALTFYARTDVDAVSFDLLGFGNDNTGTSLYGVARERVGLTRDWSLVIIPIPNPAKIVAERGLFTFAESLEANPDGSFVYPDGYHIWLDEIKYARLGNITIFRASMPSVTRQYFVGSKVTLQGTSTVFRVDGAPIPVGHSPSYFDYASSDPAVASVVRGEIVIQGVGAATITAKLDTLPVIGRVSLNGYLPPTEAAVPPTLPAQDVISMFSDVYADVPVDTWNPHWGGSTTQDEIYVIDGDNTRMYSALNWVGILFQNPTVDATAMTHLHLDVYAPAGTNFGVKLGCYPSGGSTLAETTDLVLTASTTPAFTSGGWSSLDIPLASFALPATWDWGYISEIVLSTSDAQLVLIDNLYWHR